ncbi:unnamed protein product [Lampetra fluviatilis]
MPSLDEDDHQQDEEEQGGDVEQQQQQQQHQQQHQHEQEQGLASDGDAVQLQVPSKDMRPLIALIIERFEVTDESEDQVIVSYQGGNVYSGSFCNNMMHGKGQYVWADGVEFEGDFWLNAMVGNGTYQWPDGSKYTGNVDNGVRHGQGTMTVSKPFVLYSGQWYASERHGKGILYYDEKKESWYCGEWHHNMRHGWGIRRYPSGNIYEGQWLNNERHGEGCMRWVTSMQEYNGQWKHGKPDGRGTHKWLVKRVGFSQYPMCNEYDGEWAAGHRHGQGEFLYASGARYKGEWSQDRKHGSGTFTSKSGQIYEGSFVGDVMVGCSQNTVGENGLSRADASLPTKRHLEDKESTAEGGAMLQSSHVDLDLARLLQKFPADKREAEYTQVQLVVLQHMAALRRTYSKYSGLGVTHSPDNTFILSRMQWWRLLKDCRVHVEGPSLAQVDRLLSTFEEPLDQIHYPNKRLLMRQFLSNLTTLGYHMYHTDYAGRSGELAWCLSQLMNNAILPHACTIRGSVFGEAWRAQTALEYASKSWDIYSSLCKTNLYSPHEPILTARNFLWMLQEFKLISKSLSAEKVVEILSLDNPAISDGASCNLQYELTFLEFFEALALCAEVSVPERSDGRAAVEPLAHSCSGARARWSQRESEPQQRWGRWKLEEPQMALPVDKSQESTTQEFTTQESSQATTREWSPTNRYDDNTVVQDAWKNQLSAFFVEKLFGAFERNEALKAAAKKEQDQEADRAYNENIKVRQAWEQRMALEMEAMHAVERDGLNEQGATLPWEDGAMVRPDEPPSKEQERPANSPAVTKSTSAVKVALNSKPHSAKDKKKKK